MKSVALPGLVHFFQDGSLLGDDQPHSNPFAGAVAPATRLAEDDHQARVEEHDQEPQGQHRGNDR